MGRITIHIMMACLAVVCANNGAGAMDRVTLGTATPGGGFPLYGEVFARTVNAGDAFLHIQPLNTKGSSENVPLLEAGKLDIALVQGEAAHEAFSGTGRPPANLKIIAAMYATPGMFVVRGDSPYRTINDLRGKRVAFGASGSGLVILARYLLDGMGLDQNKAFQAVYLDRAGDGPAMVADGSVAALWGGGVGWPGFTAVANAPAGARFIAPDSGEIGRVLKKYPFLKEMTIPVASYPGQDKAITSVGSWSFVLARPSLPDDVAYRIARSLHHGEARLCEALAQACGTTMANTVAASPRQDMIHPGVLRYLRETKGLPCLK
jgi:TRAP transporter TAXI family solute receptor